MSEQVLATKEQVDFAIRLAQLWRAGKMIGGDEDEVRDTLLGEIERLRTALRGIHREACRGAATLALGGAQPAKQSDIRELVNSAYKDGYGADLTDDRDLSARTHELMRQLSRPAHEREPPHCVSCSCPPYDAEAVRIQTGRASGCPCKGHPTNCYRHPRDCGCHAQPPGDDPADVIMSRGDGG